MKTHFIRTLPCAIFSLTHSIPSNAEPAEPGDPPEEVILEDLVVHASPLARSADELVQPTTILAGPALELRRQATLGETLESTPGVASSTFGPGASRPIIRGLGSERVRILADGLGMLDVSGNSPDHAVSLEPALAHQVEVLRGPATLMYGSSAVGGAVNVVTENIPTSRPDKPIAGEFAAAYDTVSNGRLGVGALRGGSGAIAWTVSGSHRVTDDIDIPGDAELKDDHEEDPAEAEEHAHGTLPNSFTETSSGSAGLAWLWTGGSAGLAFTGMETQYGVPGHEHEHEEEEHGEAGVMVDLVQRRWDFRTSLDEPVGPIQSGRLAFAYSDYTHREIEDGEVATQFDHAGYEARLDLLHRPLGALQGNLGAQVTRNTLEAAGEEAYLPPTRTTQYAFFAIEELPTGPVRWQAGGRFESQEIGVTDGSQVTRAKEGFSLSAGGLWTVSDHWNLSFSLARTERLPTAQELFADGPHLATGAYEIGDRDLGKETSTSLDLELRRRSGPVTGSISVFLSRFDDFIFENETGETIDDLPVYRYVASEAQFHGGEVEVTWHLHESKSGGFDLNASADYVRADNQTADVPLPRIPPVRTLLGLTWTDARWNAGIEVRRVWSQDRVAPGESETDGYTLLGTHVGWTIPLEHSDIELFVRGSNLTDAEARPHTSFLKNVAPLPGRNVSIGARLVF